MPGQPAGSLLAALYGPTSSGKTAMAVEVASRLEGQLGRKVVIISADSRQVYRYMNIGTSKTTPEQMRGIPHEMLDVAEPVRKFELEEYARLARRHITDALAAGVVPFIVGGTGVYVRALLEGWELDQVGAARSSLRRDFPPSMAEDAYAMLRRLDRQAAARVHPHNYAAVINALAARMAAGSRTARPERADLATVVLGLDPGLRALAERVADTYQDQLRRGLLGEILDLNDRYQLDTEMRRRGHDSPNQVLHTHGYREYFEVAAERGKNVADLTDAEHAEVGNRVVHHIRGYTGRQRSWFSKLPAVRMIRSPGQAFQLLAQAIRADPLSSYIASGCRRYLGNYPHDALSIGHAVLRRRPAAEPAHGVAEGRYVSRFQIGGPAWHGDPFRPGSVVEAEGVRLRPVVIADRRLGPADLGAGAAEAREAPGRGGLTQCPAPMPGDDHRGITRRVAMRQGRLLA